MFSMRGQGSIRPVVIGETLGLVIMLLEKSIKRFGGLESSE